MMTPEEHAASREWWKAAMGKTSLLYWWPKIKGLGIPVPKTAIHIVHNYGNGLMSILDGASFPEADVAGIRAVADEIGYPCFIRSDMTSAKHSWERGAVVHHSEELFDKVWCLVEDNALKDQYISAIVVREYLAFNPLESFQVPRFGNLPVRRERRIFIRDGQIEVILPYWPLDALQGTIQDLAEWRPQLEVLNDLAWELPLLTDYGKTVASTFPEYWSVDFMWAEGKWWLIDMAEGEKSWRP